MPKNDSYQHIIGKEFRIFFMIKTATGTQSFVHGRNVFFLEKIFGIA